MFRWRKSAELHWIKEHEDRLQAYANGQLVIVRRPGRKRMELEITCRSRPNSITLLNKFGGRIEPLPRNWLKQFTRADSKPIKIGKRLIISCVGRSPASRLPRREGRSTLIIPASLAFGTGEHATTAMSLRLLEKLTLRWKRGWSFVDLGSGSGIFALAAKRLGAGRVIAIDNDSTAISVAKSNARLNGIRSTSFQLGDVHKWKPPPEIDITMANLYSDLLIEILPKLGGSRWLILSGILYSQKGELVRVLRRNSFDAVSVKRRGKWVAILARRMSTLQAPGFGGRKFCGGHRLPLQ